MALATGAVPLVLFFIFLSQTKKSAVINATVHELQRVKARLKTVKQERDCVKAQLKSSIAASVGYQKHLQHKLNPYAVERFRYRQFLVSNLVFMRVESMARAVLL